MHLVWLRRDTKERLCSGKGYHVHVVHVVHVGDPLGQEPSAKIHLGYNLQSVFGLLFLTFLVELQDIPLDAIS